MLLYTFTITPNNRKVEAFVKHYDLDVDIHHVSFKDRETQSPEYLAINPMGKVPALVDGDFNLWESNAILTYLASTFPETKALPTDIRGRADVDRWLHWQSCHLMQAMGALKASDVKDPDAITPLLEDSRRATQRQGLYPRPTRCHRFRDRRLHADQARQAARLFRDAKSGCLA